MLCSLIDLFNTPRYAAPLYFIKRGDGPAWRNFSEARGEVKKVNNNNKMQEFITNTNNHFEPGSILAI